MLIWEEVWAFKECHRRHPGVPDTREVGDRIKRMQFSAPFWVLICLATYLLKGDPARMMGQFTGHGGSPKQHT